MTDDRPVSRGRHRAFTILTIVAGLGIGLGAFAFPSLLLAWFGLGDREAHRIHDLAWGAHAGLLIAVPLLLQAKNPDRKPAAMQAAALGGVALVVGYAVAGSFSWLALIPIVILGTLWWLHPGREVLLSVGRRIRPVMAMIVLLVAVPLVAYGLHQAEIQRACPDPVEAAPGGALLQAQSEEARHCDELHFAGMTAWSFGLVLVGLLGSTAARGWTIAGFSVGASALVVGVASILFRMSTSSLGSRWGGAAVVGGLAYIALAEIARRRTPP